MMSCIVAHGERRRVADREGIDLKRSPEWRPATLAETLRAIAEDIRREREGRSLRKLGPGFKTIPGGRS